MHLDQIDHEYEHNNDHSVGTSAVVSITSLLPPPEKSQQTSIISSHVSCTWVVKNFSLLTEKYVEKLFSLQDTDNYIRFKVQLFPCVTNESSINCVLIRMLFHSINNHRSRTFKAIGEITILDSNGQKCAISQG